ncbi:hypothetical protein Tco_1303216 [Tanacetum coccineum]
MPSIVSPTVVSPGYVPESDPEEGDDEDPEEDPADYPANGGDDGDDEDESSDDDKDDDDVDIKEDEEHLAPVDSTAVAFPAVEHAPSAEGTESFETDESTATPPPHPAYRVTARISIRDESPAPFWSDTEVVGLLAIPTPPPSPLSPRSSLLPQIPSPPLPPILSPLPISSPLLVSPLLPLAPPPLHVSSTSHSPPPHIILSHTKVDRPPSADKPEVCLPPQKRLCLLLVLDKDIMRDLERDVSYGITNTWDEMLVDMPRAPATDDTELGRRMTEFSTRVR